MRIHTYKFTPALRIDDRLALRLPGLQDSLWPWGGTNLYYQPNAARFYDMNWRPGFESPALVDELPRVADVVKVNERELQFLHEHLHLPADPEGFCRVGAERYAWRAACVIPRRHPRDEHKGMIVIGLPAGDPFWRP